jgi:uncharacterized membrane protein
MSQGISTALVVFCALLIFFGGFIFIAGTEEVKESSAKHLKTGGIISIIVGIIFGLTGAVLPSEKAIYMVAGIELVNKFSQTETAKELGDSGMNIVKDISTIIHDYTLDDKRR